MTTQTNDKTTRLDVYTNRAYNPVEEATSIDQENQKDEVEIIVDKVARHTIGRVSCLLRLPYYVFGFTLQTVKIVVKGLFSPLVTFAAWVANTKKLDTWTFKGVAKDGLALSMIANRTGSSAFGVIFAPPKQYREFGEGIQDVTKLVLGTYHEYKHKTGQINQDVIIEPPSVADTFLMAKLQCPNYTKLVFDNAPRDIAGLSKRVKYSDSILEKIQFC
jgi:hypothetical protein